MSCPACGSEKLGASMTASGIKTRCYECGCLFDEQPEAENAIVHEPVVVKQTQIKQNTQAKTVVKTAGIPGILANARVRVRELDTEIKRLESLRKERDELRRLLAAAKKKPRESTKPALVKSLRTNTGN